MHLCFDLMPDDPFQAFHQVRGDSRFVMDLDTSERNPARDRWHPQSSMDARLKALNEWADRIGGASRSTAPAPSASSVPALSLLDSPRARRLPAAVGADMYNCRARAVEVRQLPWRNWVDETARSLADRSEGVLRGLYLEYRRAGGRGVAEEATLRDMRTLRARSDDSPQAADLREAERRTGLRRETWTAHLERALGEATGDDDLDRPLRQLPEPHLCDPRAPMPPETRRLRLIRATAVSLVLIGWYGATHRGATGNPAPPVPLQSYVPPYVPAHVTPYVPPAARVEIRPRPVRSPK
jgi:hypothetical protein